MEITGYILAWKIYIASGALILIALLSLFWVFSKRWVVFIMILAAVLMFWPYSMPDLNYWKVPAVLASMIELMVIKSETWYQPLSGVLKMASLVIVAYLCFLGYLFYKERNEVG